jgi:two-component system, chemotaxis family, sensor kinase CheA
MDELLEQFLIESRELIELAAADLFALERAPDDRERIDSAFRAIHTLKGAVGLFGLVPMAIVLQAAEDVLGAWRDGNAAPDAAAIDRLMPAVNTLETWLEAFAAGNDLPGGAAEEAARLAAPLLALAGIAPVSASAPAPVAAASRGHRPDWLAPLLAAHATDLAKWHDAGAGLAGSLAALRYVPTRDCFFRGEDPLAILRAVPRLLAVDLALTPEPEGAEPDPFACRLVIRAISAAPEAEVASVFRLIADQVEIVAVAAPARLAASRTLRVDATRLDTLADIAGELIVTKNRLAHLAAEAPSSAPAIARPLGAIQAELDRLVGDMHRAIMRARMVPLSQTTRRMARLVRETAGQLGKEVAFDISGDDTEADRAIVEALFEPLLHLLRNAVDHGIEPPDARSAAGKPRAGSIRLEVRRDGDQIGLTVTDDGAGVSPVRLRESAQRRGILDPDTIDRLTDEEALQLVFMPGFSTATAITEVSGRGVGLDAVRSTIEALGGRVTVSSTEQFGSSWRMAVPEAVVLRAVMLVETGGQVFGVPLAAVAETVLVPADRIVRIGDGEAFVLRGGTVPLLRLGALLHLKLVKQAADRPDEAPERVKVLVVQLAGQLAEGQPVGVAVDRLGERMDIAIRPVGGLLAGMSGLLGAGVMGDGSVLLVLDMAGLIG